MLESYTNTKILNIQLLSNSTFNNIIKIFLCTVMYNSVACFPEGILNQEVILEKISRLY